MENASANADPDAHVPQLASGGEDGILEHPAQSSTDTVEMQYARDILLRNYVSCGWSWLPMARWQGWGLLVSHLPSLAFKEEKLEERERVGWLNSFAIIRWQMGSIGSRRGPCMKVWQYKLLWKGNVSKISEQQNIISTLSNLIWSLFTGEHYLE